MNKIDMISKIAQTTGMKNEETKVIIETFLKFIQETLIAGDDIQIKGFGRFFNKKRLAKVARDLNSNTTIIVPAHYKPTLRLSKDFVEKVKKAIPAK